jgi:hypothetical protein
MPTEEACSCEELLITDPRPSIITIYTHDGPTKGTNYHKKCKTCGIKYYYSYLEDLSGAKTFRSTSLDLAFFCLSSKSGYAKNYLKSTADLIELGAVTFTALCDSYTATHGLTLERQRLEEAYFAYRLVDVFLRNGHKAQMMREGASHRLDIEDMCRRGLEVLLMEDNVYRTHSCDKPGCREGFVKADGIEKVSVSYNSKYLF